MALIDDMPMEIYPLIYNHLKLNDLIICRSVNKKFKFACDQYRVNDLIMNEDEDQVKSMWFYSFDLIDYRYSINLTTLINVKGFDLMSTVKRIHIKNMSTVSFHLVLDRLKEFGSLEQLEIGCHLNNYSLSLPNLKILKLAFSQISLLVLDLPKLTILEATNVYRLNFLSSKQTIKHIVTHDRTYNLKSFSNIECLQVDYHFDQITSTTLADFPNLKQFHLNAKFLSSELFDEVKEIMHYLLKQRLVQRRIDLKIYFCGVELSNSSKFDELIPHRITCTMDILRFQIQNYNSLLSNLSFHNSIDYSELIDLLKDERNSIKIPCDFFSKFICIESVYTKSKIENLDNFLCFLGRSQFLKSLTLYNSSVDLSILSSYVPYLNTLRIRDDQPQEIDYAFILDFKFLKSFDTNQEFSASFDLALEAFKQLSFLSSFVFKYKENNVAIYTSPMRTTYNIRCDNAVNFANHYFIKKLDYAELDIICRELNGSRMTRSQTRVAKLVKFRDAFMRFFAMFENSDSSDALFDSDSDLDSDED